MAYALQGDPDRYLQGNVLDQRDPSKLRRLGYGELPAAYRLQEEHLNTELSLRYWAGRDKQALSPTTYPISHRNMALAKRRPP